MEMPVHPTLKLGFLASHGGSGMRAVLAAIAAGDLNAEARILITNNRDCAARQAAEAAGLASRHISSATEGTPESADRAIAEALSDAGAELVVLSGYMRKLGPQTLERSSNWFRTLRDSVVRVGLSTWLRPHPLVA